MAKLEKVVNGNFDEILKLIEDEILRGSLSATLEDQSDYREEDSRCSVRVFERYSYTGSNRLSLTVTLFQTKNNPIKISCISSGGSQGLIFKINTIGENAFLNKMHDIFEKIEKRGK